MQVFVQPADGLDVSLLDDVRSVDAPLQAAVEAQLHHAPQARPMPGKKLIQSRLVAGTDLFQQVGGSVGVVDHEGNHQILTPEGEEYWTGREQFSRKSSADP